MQSTIEIPKGTSSTTGPKLPIPFPIWVRWMVGSFLCLAGPICKKVLRIEDGVEKAIDTVAETVEKVAELVEKVAVDVANALPDNSNLKQEAMEVEQIAEDVEKDAEKAEQLIDEVDHTKEDIEAFLEHVFVEWELVDKETEGQEEEKTDPSANS